MTSSEQSMRMNFGTKLPVGQAVIGRAVVRCSLNCLGTKKCGETLILLETFFYCILCGYGERWNLILIDLAWRGISVQNSGRQDTTVSTCCNGLGYSSAPGKVAQNLNMYVTAKLMSEVHIDKVLSRPFRFMIDQ